MKKNKINFVFFFILLNIFTALSFFQVFTTTDFLWVFENIYKMNTGIIYNCNNVIDTPLFFLLGSVLFKTFGANILTFLLFNICIWMTQYILLFIIFKKLKINNLFIIFFSLITLIFNLDCIGNGANYNIFSINLILLGIIIYLHFYNSKAKLYNLLQGLIIFLIFMTKQNIGIYYALGVVTFELITLKFSKLFLKNQFLKLISFLPCICISILLMLHYGNFYNFINYCFGSLFEFGSNNKCFSTKTVPYLLFIFFIIIFSIFYLIKSKKSDTHEKNNVLFLLCISIGSTFIIYPIANIFHVVMSLNFYFILFSYIIYSIFLNEVEYEDKKIKFLVFILGILVVFQAFALRFYFIFYFKEFTLITNNSPFYGAFIDNKSIEKISEITDYISTKSKENINVVVLSYEAGIYNIPLNINNLELDMPLEGNLGYNGIQKTINKISNMENTEFLIFTNEDDMFYQESMEIREYIINNFEKKGELSNYSIYTNK